MELCLITEEIWYTLHYLTHNFIGWCDWSIHFDTDSMVNISFYSENISIFVTVHHIERILHKRSFNMKITKQIFDMFLKLCIL